MDTFKLIIKKLFWCFHGFNKYNGAYKIVSLVGLILRVALLPYVLPNVFEVIADYFIAQLGLPPLLYEFLLRIVLFLIDAIGVSRIFYWITFFTVGNFYESGTIPAYGSLCYTFFYFIYMGMPILLINFFYWWVIALTYTVYSLICVGAYFISFQIEVIPEEFIFRAVTHGIILIVIIVATCLLKALVFI